VKAQDFARTLARHAIGPLYLIVGEEAYLRDHAVAALRAACFGGADPSVQAPGSEADGLAAFNYDLLYGDEVEGADLVTRASQAPVFASRRLVLVKSADKLPARVTEAILPYLLHPCESTTLAFVAEKLDGRTKFAQALKDRAVTVDCGALPPAGLPAWIAGEAARLGLRLSEDAVGALQELAVESLYLARQELAKLAAYLPPGVTAGVADVDRLRGVEGGASVFDLAEAIGSGDYERALRIVARNLDAGEAPVRILGALIWQYRRLWKAKDWVRQGRRESDLARGLGIPPFRLRPFLGLAARMPEAHLRAAFALFPEVDSQLKGGSATSPALVLERLLFRLCGDVPPSRGGRQRRGAKDHVKTEQSSAR
jgi:DNA polymerase-3 subunit delta